MTKQSSSYCQSCGKVTLHAKEGISNLLHLVLSIVTVGLWIPVWIFLGMKSAGSRSRCQVCGTKSTGYAGPSARTPEPTPPS